MYLANVVFFDEVHFHFDGTVSRHNHRYWAPKNHHRTLEKRLHSPRTTVWTAFWLGGVFRPLFFDDYINSEHNLALLQNGFSQNLGKLIGLQHDCHARRSTSTLGATDLTVVQRNSSPSVDGTRISQYTLTTAFARPDPMRLFHEGIPPVKGLQDQTNDNSKLKEPNPRSFPRNNAGNM